MKKAERAELVQRRLAELYPEDRAVGFRVGEKENRVHDFVVF